MKKILILANSISGLYSFRKELMQILVEDGCEVTIAAPAGERMKYFTEIGCHCIEVPINRHSVNPISDFTLFLRFIGIMRRVRPDAALTYTIKPNVYGGLVCRLLRIPYIANITGLGDSIENGGILQKVALMLYRLGLKEASCVFFQNDSNRRFFQKNAIAEEKAKLIPGSGVNLEQHCFEEYPDEKNGLTFLFIGRMSKDKGIEEFLEAAQVIRGKYPKTQFHLIGNIEGDYSEKIKDLEKRGIITYLGRQNDVHAFIKGSHATILPSYHEGTSNVLLESASTGRPVLASRVTGCRETFDEGVSGLGFEARNVDSLVKTIMEFIKLPHEKKSDMGLEGRRKMEREFDREFVINAYMQEICKIIGESEESV